MTKLFMDETEVVSAVHPVNWISVGDDAFQATTCLPKEYWDQADKAGFLGIDRAESGYEGLDVLPGGNAALYLPVPSRNYDTILAENALSQYINQLTDLLEGTRLNALLAFLGKSFPSGITPSLARLSQQQGAVTVAVVSLPHPDEGRKHVLQSEFALKETQSNVDATCTLSLETMCDDQPQGISMTELENRIYILFNRAMRGIVDLTTFPGFRAPLVDDVVGFFRGAGEILYGHSTIKQGSKGTLEAITHALRNPYDDRRSFEGADEVLVSVCLGSEELEQTCYRSIGRYCRNLLGNSTEVRVGCFRSVLATEEPWIAVYGRGAREVRLSGFEYPLSQPPHPAKSPARLPAYYRKFYGQSIGGSLS